MWCYRTWKREKYRERERVRVRVKTRARTTARARVWIICSNLHFCVIFFGFTQRLHFIWMLQLEWLTFARIQCNVYIIFFACMQCVNAILPFSCEPCIMVYRPPCKRKLDWMQFQMHRNRKKSPTSTAGVMMQVPHVVVSFRLIGGSGGCQRCWPIQNVTIFTFHWNQIPSISYSDTQIYA